MSFRLYFATDVAKFGNKTTNSVQKVEILLTGIFPAAIPQFSNRLTQTKRQRYALM